jgi:threonine/homoserine/homoserine lactone efflux protein
MALSDLIALFTILLVLAAMPSASVLLVVARSSVSGFRHGASVAAGIVCGDLLFASLALVGMSAVAELLGEFFLVIKYLAGLYLIWFGWSLLRSPRISTPPPDVSRSPVGDFVAGFVLTLGDAKAIFFYASLFPAFVDVGAPSASQFAAVLLVTVGSVGLTKLTYAKIAASARLPKRLRTYGSAVRKMTGGVVLGTGIFVITKSP